MDEGFLRAFLLSFLSYACSLQEVGDSLLVVTVAAIEPKIDFRRQVLSNSDGVKTPFPTRSI